ncbi:MAG: hypothetical protein JHC85_08270 [Chthoniobacterales bacterium]|nr:hypothetical protein [Chthoniobacterales bacterium]
MRRLFPESGHPPSWDGKAAALALFLMCLNGLAAPGGYLVDAISDEFDTKVSEMWGPGLRGMPESLVIQDGVLSLRSVDNGDDDYPSAEDMICTYANQLGQPLSAADGPSVVGWVWLPPFSEWPTGTNASGFREWLGLRVTAYDDTMPYYSGSYWPGIYVATDDAGPCFIARVGDGYSPDITIGRVAASGWWTMGLSWNAQGRTQYYAAPGRVTLTEADLLHTTPTHDSPIMNRSIDQLLGTFLALRMTLTDPPTGQLSPDWRIDRIGVYVKTPPALPQIIPSIQNGWFHLAVAGCSRGFRYVLQASDDLSSRWQDVHSELSDGGGWTFEEPTSNQRFYRIFHP